MAADVTQGAPGSMAVNTLLLNLLKVLQQKENELQACKQQLNQALQDKKVAEINTGGSQSMKKPPLLHTKSDPIVKRKLIENRRISAPEIFLFPDTGNKKTAARMEDTSYTPASDIRQIGTGHMDARPPGSMPSTIERSLGSSGVCEQHFHSVLMELVKTKKALRHLQFNQGIFERGQKEKLKLEQEVQQLHSQNCNLQQELDRLKHLNMENSKDRKAPQNVAKDNSFEIDEVNQISVCTQTERSSSHIQVFADEREKTLPTDEMEKLRKDNSTLHQQYNDLKSSIKILTTCLEEEKKRNLKLGEDLEKKNSESTKLSYQLGSSRQRYEELLEEKTALEKTMALQDTHSGGTYFSSSSHGSDRFSSSHVRSGDRQPINIQAGGLAMHGHRSSSYGNVPLIIPQNDLSGRLSSERAPSNLEECAVGAVAATEDHPQYSCPQCLKEFSLEHSYFSHLNKCIE